MKDAETIILIISGVVFFGFLVILVFVIRGWAIRSFHRRCRGAGLTPSPLDRWYCLGNWQDARVAIEKCGTRRCDTLFVYMDLGELPAEALRNLNYYMQGLNADFYSLSEYRGKLEFYRIVSGSWSAPFLYSSHLRARANEFHIRKMLEALYRIRCELRRRVFQK